MASAQVLQIHKELPPGSILVWALRCSEVVNLLLDAASQFLGVE